MPLNQINIFVLRWLPSLLMVVALVTLFCLNPAEAANRSFTRRFNTNANGDIKLIGNTSMSCGAGTTGNGISCEAARSGGYANNNDFYMLNVDIDGDSSTFNSSSADLGLTSGSNVLWAGLYWGGQSSSSSRRQVLISTPGSFGYSLVTASQLDEDTSMSPARFSCFADVTALVRASGNGTYTVANIQTFNNQKNTYAGWSLVVVYGNSSLPLRNLTVFDGYQVVDQNTSASMTINGFLTPLTGAVTTTLGAMTYEGDLNLSGDNYNFNGVAMSDAVHSATNFFNSSISELGSHITAKSPNYRNQLGFDIAKLDVSGKLANGATSATFSTSTNSDQYYPAVLTFATDLYVPIIIPNFVKTITKVNNNGSPALMPGDTVRFTITMKNTGQDTATNLVLNDNIPAYTTYVPGSLKITSGANSGSKSDASGDDQAEYIASPAPHVVFRLGSGADSAQGGTLPYTASTTLTFDATINSGIPSGTVISNTAQITYGGQTITTTTYAGTSSAATAAVIVPPAITKSFATNPIPPGGSSKMSIVVSNPSSNPATLTGVTFSDSYPSGLTNAGAGAISCTAGSSATLTGGVAGGAGIGMSGGSIAAGGSCTVAVNVTSAAVGNYTNSTGNVASANGGTGSSASATLSVGTPVITTSFFPASINAGGTSTVTFTIANQLASQQLSGLAFSDPLTNIRVAGTPSVTNTCGGTVTAAPGGSSISLSGGTLAANGTCTVTVNVTSSTIGSNPNQTGAVTSTSPVTSGSLSNIASLEVIGAPVATVIFSPPSIVRSGNGGSSRLNITITNPNASATLSNVGFSSSYPANLLNTTSSATIPSPNASISCSSGSSGTLSGGTAGGTALGVSGATLLPGGSCTVSVNVTSASAGDYTVSTGSITSSGGSGVAASNTLNVSSLAAPTVTKSFSPATIYSGNTSTLTITLNNANATTITGAAFTDIYPSGMVNYVTPNATTTCANGTVTATAGGTSLSLSGATIPASGSCMVKVQVTADAQGSYYNTIPAGSVTTANAGINAADVAAILAVNSGPVTIKYFSTNPIVANTVTRLNIAVANPNASAITNVAFTDTYPAGMLNTSSPNATLTCYKNDGSTTSTTSSATLTGGGAGANTVGMSGGAIQPNEKCVVSVNVTAPAGGYENSTGAVTSNQGSGPPAVTSLTVMGAPAVVKTFSPALTELGATTSPRVTITFTNKNQFDITGVTFSDNYPNGMVNTPSPGFGNTCGGTLTATAGGGSLALSGGTVPAGGSCAVSANVVTNTVGSFTNSTGPITTSNAGIVSAATATLKVGVGAAGFVYNDLNHNSSMDGAEAGLGLQLYVKLAARSGAACASPAISAATVDSASGTYSFFGLEAGDFCLILSTNSTLSDVNPAYPAGWIGTESSGGIRQITISAARLVPQNFGLYAGNSITGIVFSDTGAGGGTANDGQQNGAEAGIASVTVKLTDESGATVYDTRVTDSSGSFVLRIPGTIATGTKLKIIETNPPAYVSTGASAGTTSGTYDRNTDAISFTYNGGSYSGVAFGDIPENRFLTDNTASALPGSVVFHPHIFTAGSVGSVSFSTLAVPTPTLPGWSEVIFRDSNCNGSLDSGELQISSAVSLGSGEQICILVKEFVPAGAPMGAANQVTITATFTYANNASLSRQLTRADVTQVGTPSGAGLTLTKAVDQAAALPGSNLTYTITYANNSSGPLSAIVIHDSVPAYTTYVDACCVNPSGACLGTAAAAFPASITACSAGISGEAITWTTTGTLAPGASGQVKFRVTVQP